MSFKKVTSFLSFIAASQSLVIAANPLLDNNIIQFKPVNPNIPQYDYQNETKVSSIYDLTPDMMSETKIIKVDGTKSFIKHISAFNTAGDTTDEFDTDRGPDVGGIRSDTSLIDALGVSDYYEIKFGDVSAARVDDMLPLGGCFSSKYSSSGGSITFTKGMTIGLTGTASASSVLSFLPLSPSYTPSNAYSASWDVNIAFTCNVNGNNTVQLFFSPSYVEVSDVAVRTVKVSKNFFGKVTVDAGEYHNFGTIKAFKNNGPALECITDTERLECLL